MRLTAYRLRNFRRLQDVRIDLEKDVTVFVGANNSGKTSATTGVRMFVSGNKQNFSIHDFSAACWAKFESIGKACQTAADPLPIMSLDLWFHVDDSDAYRVLDLIPSLDWSGGRVGIRIEFAPRDQYLLLENCAKAIKSAQSIDQSEERVATFQPWPKTLIEYLERKLWDEYAFRYYVLDATKFDDELACMEDSGNLVQLPEDGEMSGKKVLASLIRVDFLDAQRHLSDSDEGSRNEDLSRRLSKYYKYLNQHDTDFEALHALAESEKHLNIHFSSVFQSTMDSLQKLGYPGLDQPHLTVRSALNPEALLAKAGGGAQVHYTLPGVQEMTLPDRYNGLGFKNLIYMVVELLEMHTRWLAETTTHRPPLHVVFIEEPEAHLHTQLQQVFIKQILDIPALKVLHPYVRQHVVTTHSPHILYQRGFNPIRYFRRQLDLTSQVLNLTNFEQSSSKEDVDFLRRYIKLMHCDLFFADAAILVEGNVERLLLPQMIDKAAPQLASSHLSIIEVSGAFAHRFRVLLEFLGIPTLIITDIDSVEGAGHRKTCPPNAVGAITSNPILSTWLPKLERVSDLHCATSADRTSVKAPSARGRIHVTYQMPIEVSWKSESKKRSSRTLEEAFGLENLTWIQNDVNKELGLYFKDNSGMDLDTLAIKLFEHVTSENFKKTDFALALLAGSDEEWRAPDYIVEGLQWLNEELNPLPSVRVTDLKI